MSVLGKTIQLAPPPALAEPVKQTVVEVGNLSNAVKEADLKLIFENEQLTGGGATESIQIDTSRAVATITFVDEKGKCKINKLMI